MLVMCHIRVKNYDINMVYTNLITHFLQHSYQNFTIGYIFIGNSDKGKFIYFWTFSSQNGQNTGNVPYKGYKC